MRTLIAVPCMDKLDTAFVQCLLKLQMDEDDGVVFMASSLIYDSRNQLARQAQVEGYDYIFWLDSDMIFEPDVLVRLKEAIKDKDIVCGKYYGRRAPFRPIIYSRVEYEECELGVIPVSENYYNSPKEGMFEIEGCGFGCVLMKTAVATDVQSKYGLPFSPLAGFGEDLSFCYKARKAGYKIYCEPAIKLGHIAQITITEEYSELWGENNG